ncbi:hypothetical protein [Roseobacter sp. A03A-229]
MRDQIGEATPAAHRYQTNYGARGFAVGDRIVFLKNNRDLGVNNGMLGTVTAVDAGGLSRNLGGRGGARVNVSTEAYAAIDNGYATRIHKTHGATVDRAFVLASRAMDRQLAYVAMTRHRTDSFMPPWMISQTNGRAGWWHTVLRLMRTSRTTKTATLSRWRV